MASTAPTLDQLRVLRSIVFAGALGDASDIIGYRGADIAADIGALTSAGLIEIDGFLMPTEAGIATLEGWYAKDRAGLGEPDRDAVIARFRPLDLEIKRLATRWQDADERDDWDGRMSVIEALNVLHDNIGKFIAEHRDRLPRFEEFGDRLGIALEKILDGETDYVVSVRLPSYHTVWFEFHEDLLRTLERHRDPE